MKNITLTTLIVLAVLAFTQQILPQGATNISPDRGVSSGKTYAISDIESIGLFGGNLMFNVPLGSLPAGRGGMSAGVNLRYDSKLWDVFNFDIERFTTTHDVKTLFDSEDGGWKYGYKYELKIEYQKYPFGVGNCTFGNDSSFYPYRFQLVTPDGARHPLSSSSGIATNENGFMNVFPDGQPACGTSPTAPTSGSVLTYYTTDGTFLRLDLIADGDTDWENNVWSIGSRDGTRITHNPTSGVTQRIADRNNNYVDVIENATDSNYSSHKTTYLLDQMARKVVIEYEAATNEDQIHSKGFDGETITTKVKWKNITVHKFAHAGEVAPSPADPDAFQNWEISQDFRVVDEVILPDQLDATLKYTFDYDVDDTSAVDTGWGEVNKVTLPSGAFAEYDYKYDNHSGWNDDPDTDIMTEQVLYNRVVEKRLTYNVVYDGSSSEVTDTWTYVTEGWQYGAVPDIESVEITAPNGAKTKEFYSDNYYPSPIAIMPSVKGENYKTTGPDGSRVEKIYTSNVPGNCHEWFKANRYVKYEFTSIADSGGTPVKTAIKEYTQDKNGNTTEVKEYDFFTYSAIPRDGNGKPTGLPSGASSNLKRITKTEFYGDTPEASSTTYTDADSYHLVSSSRLRSLPKSSEIQDGSATPKSRSEITYDYTSYSTNTVGGNPTVTKSWDSTIAAYSNPLSSNYITTSAAYDGHGNPTLTTDANAVQTAITYDSVGGYSGLYPTQTVVAYGTGLARTTTAVYDFHSGAVTSTTDEDNDVTNATEYDDLVRPVKSITAQGTALESWTMTEYHDEDRFVVVKSDLETKGDYKKVSTLFSDELGRVRLAKTLEDAATQSATNETDGIKVQTRYATTNSSGTGYTYQLSSNPYRATTSSGASGETTMGWTRSKAIHTGRHSEVETFSGSSLPAPWGSSSSTTGVVQTDTDADRTLVTDQAGKQRISKTNALGQLKDVWEVKSSDSDTESISFPSQSLSAGYKTSYSYDTLNNLTTVTQGSQTRTFTYSSLARLLSAANPESGTITYTYDVNGNLATKMDARSITTTYAYDYLNRVTTRSYNDSPQTPTVTYTYDAQTHAKGKLTQVASSVSTTEYTAFDILGRVTGHKQTTDGNDYTTAYAYNLSGALLEETYPSTRVVKNTVDASGDLSQVTSKESSSAYFKTYVNDFVYTPAGAVSSLKLGNGKFETTSFNSRLHPTQIALGASVGDTSALKLDYGYGTTANNGNVLTQDITVKRPGTSDLVFNQTYTYDELDRLKIAEEKTGTTTNWKQTFTFDRYGNRRFDQSNTTSPSSFSNTNLTNPTFNTANNRMASGQNWTYDSAGNVTVDPDGRTFTYDGENKQTEVKNSSSVSLGTYFFDGDGKRVKKVVPSTGETTIFVFDSGGKLVAEYSTIVAPVETAKVKYLTNDNLGTPRINTDAISSIVSRSDYMPYGEEIVTLGGRSSTEKYLADDIRQGFTGYERDAESVLEFAQARMYGTTLGRLTSTDPILFEPKRATDPQRINLYAYTRNNPSALTDSTGQKIDDDDLKDNEKYQSWKKACMKTSKCKSKWQEYDAKKDFTLKMSVGDRGTKNKGAEVKDFKFNDSKALVGATMELGLDLSAAGGVNLSDYPVTGLLVTDNTCSGNSRVVGKIAHEFGHLDDFLSIGTAFYDQQQVMDPYSDYHRKLSDSGMTSADIFADKKFKQLSQSVMEKTGHSPNELSTIRENRADNNAIPIIRQVTGTTETLQAATRLSKNVPKY